MAAEGFLALALVVTPDESAIGVPVRAELRLTNRGAEPLLVNARLLANRASAPDGYGEVSFQVDGPPAYANAVSFHVRAGRPQPSDFRVLEPGDSVASTYELSRYESLHLAGWYEVRAVYRNPVESTTAGRHAFIGSAMSPVVRVLRRG